MKIEPIFTNTQICSTLTVKNVHIIFFCYNFALLLKILKEWLKFNYVFTIFFNKTSGQTLCWKSQTIYSLEGVIGIRPSHWKVDVVSFQIKQARTFIA
jgi:hypothetical protein